MAIYHLHIDSYRRSRGRTAVGGMAYRRGLKAGCRHSGKHYNFRGKGEVALSGFVNADGDETDYSQLSNLVLLYETIEQNETHCRATVGREIEVALPVELDLADQQVLILGFIEEARQTFGAERSFFDYSIHNKLGNPHCHICMSEREQVAPFSFSKTKRRDWDGQEFIKQCRLIWERHTNTALVAAGVGQRVDSRSHADRGLIVLPSLHEGRAAYFHSEVKTMNNQIKQVNEEIKKKQVLKAIPAAPKPTLSTGTPNPPKFDEDAEWSIQTEGEAAAHELRQLLKSKYNHQFGFSKYISRIELKGEYAILYFKDRSSITDHGDRIVAEGGSAELSAYRLIEIAKAKSWHTVSFTGNEDFLRCAFERALAEGMEIVPKDEAQEKLLTEIRRGKGSVETDMTETKMIVPIGSSLQERILKHHLRQKPNNTPEVPKKPRRGRKSGA
ncbi:MobA/MobL family protein [Ferriphaselus sp. R-1]|uniref:MobA/MobL family protein n=1 Tax=Ferriphaselus sp. R-1 TaxID=1485544 RepID=UPI001378F935|nr:MobA/MobL family protein [Ferriphaselus sp. R-1]